MFDKHKFLNTEYKFNYNTNAPKCECLNRRKKRKKKCEWERTRKRESRWNETGSTWLNRLARFELEVRRCMFSKALQGTHKHIYTHEKCEIQVPVRCVDYANGHTSNDAFYEVKWLQASYTIFLSFMHTILLHLRNYFNKWLCNTKLKTKLK